MPIFRVKSVKIYTSQKIYTGIPVAPVTNIRYGPKKKIRKNEEKNTNFRSHLFRQIFP